MRRVAQELFNYGVLGFYTLRFASFAPDNYSKCRGRHRHSNSRTFQTSILIVPVKTSNQIDLRYTNTSHRESVTLTMQTGTDTSSAVHLHFDVVPGSTFEGPVHVCISLLAHTVQYGKGSVPTPSLSTWTSQSTWVRGMNRVRGLDGMKGRSMGSLRPEQTRTNPRSKKRSRATMSCGLYERATFTYRLGDRYRYYNTPRLHQSFPTICNKTRKAADMLGGTISTSKSMPEKVLGPWITSPQPSPSSMASSRQPKVYTSQVPPPLAMLSMPPTYLIQRSIRVVRSLPTVAVGTGKASPPYNRNQTQGILPRKH